MQPPGISPFARACVGFYIPAGERDLVQFTNDTIDVRLAPQDAGAIVEQVEVMSVITFLLDYLELYVLVIQSVIQNGGVVLVGQGEAVLVEKRRDLPGSQPVPQA